MDRAYQSGAAGSAPSAPASPSTGYPTAGNPGTGTPATKPGAYWYYMITEELRAVIAAGGLTPSQSDITQLLQALPAALASRPEMARSLTANGYQKFPGGLIIQWGSGITNGSGDASITFPLAFTMGGPRVAVTGSDANAVTVCTLSGSPISSGFSVKTKIAGGASTGLNFIWIAIGY